MKKEVKYYFGPYSIHCNIWSNDNPLPKAIIVISHGMAEHIDRYDEIANYFVDNGYVVYGADHIAHGKTSESIEKIGQIEEGDFIDWIIGDIKVVSENANKDYPEAPMYLFAHSMGSMAAQKFIEQFPNVFDKVILSGTSVGGIKYSFLKLLTGLIMKFKGPLHYSKFIQKLTMGTFDKSFKNDPVNKSWLSANIDNVNKYFSDEYCGQAFPVNYYFSLAKALNYASNKKNIEKIKAKKILLLTGKDDPVSNFSKDVIKLESLYKAQLIDVQKAIIQNARHETFNEAKELRETVYQLIVDFYNN